MAIPKGRSEAGQGGKLGHSNMDHWGFNDEVKSAARKSRRLNAKRQIALGLAERADFEETTRSIVDEDPASPDTDE